MSIKVMTWYWEYSEQEGHKLLALLALSDWANEEGECYPSVIKLSRRIRRMRRATQVVIRELENAGEILVHPGMGKGPEGMRTPLYYLLRYREANGLVVPPMLVEAALYYRNKEREQGRKGMQVRQLQVKLSGAVDNTPLGAVDNTPPGAVDNTPPGAVDNTPPGAVGCTQIRHIDPSLDPSAPSARARLESNDVAASSPAPNDAATGKRLLLANDSYEMPAAAALASGEPNRKQLQRWAPQVDPRKFVNGYIPAGMGATPTEVWYESFAVTDAQTRLTAPDQDDLRGCTDLAKLRRVITVFRQSDFRRKRNIRLILDWYRDGIPERYTGAPPTNGANGTGFGLTAYAEKERKQYERDFGPDEPITPEKEQRIREYFERRARGEDPGA